MRMTGAQALIKSLEMEGVEVIFGIPGGAILPAYDPLLDSPIRHILVRHEQGAAHAADGYAQATGRVGVCMATSGPGATNLMTGIASAFMDSVPVVAITGQVPTTSVGNDAFQEADVTGVSMPITKHNYLVTSAQDIPAVVMEAFHIASTGRPGPVLVDLPKDVLQSQMTWYWPDSVDLPGYRPVYKGNARQIREAVKLMLSSRRPVIYAGGGCIKSGASEEVRRLAELLGAPVVTTLMARGLIPDDHPLCLGMPGMHGTYAAVTSMQRSDLLIALGTRFDDRVTGKLSAFAPGAKVIHVDIDPAEIGKNRAADVPIVGDVKTVLKDLLPLLDREIQARGKPDLRPWLAQIREWQARYPLRYEQDPSGPIKPQFFIEKLFQATKGDAIYVAGVGQHQMWASQYIRFKRPRSWVNSGGLGAMGFGLPAAMGAKVGRPDEMVILIDGDGSFQMTAQELATCRLEGIPVKAFIINNGHLGMVRQWQELFYEERYSAVHLTFDCPDYVKLAEAYGCVGLRCETPDEVEGVIEKALNIEDLPVVVDVRVDPWEKVFPMVPAGASNDDIILGPSRREREGKEEAA